MTDIAMRHAPQIVVRQPEFYQPTECVPKRGTLMSSGFDLRACLSAPFLINRNARVKIDTGITLRIPYGWEGQIRSRSGNTFHDGLVVANAPGTIDADYRGQIMALMTCIDDLDATIMPGDRIAQLVFCPVFHGELELVEEIDAKTGRGTYGCGSTGKI